MNTLVAITRNEEFTCECGQKAEKIGYLVNIGNGVVNHYGSECIKKVLGESFDSKRFELKRGLQVVKLEVTKKNADTNSYMALHKVLRWQGTHYKVFAKWVIVDDLTGFEELSVDKTTISYIYKGTKADQKRDQVVQCLSVGKCLSEEELNAL